MKIINFYKNLQDREKKLLFISFILITFFDNLLYSIFHIFFFIVLFKAFNMNVIKNDVKLLRHFGYVLY